MKSRQGFLFTLVLIMLPLAGTGIDLYAPSLPTIQSIFSTTAANVKLTISIYLLGLCIGQIFFGTASDNLGRKTTVLLGTIGFIVCSLLINLSTSIFYLLIFRLGQGFCAGATAANARSIVTDIYTKEEIQEKSAYMALAWSLGPILAPVIGGYLQYYFNWKMSFYLLALYAFIVLILITTIEETNQAKVKFDFKKTITNYKSILKDSHYVGALLLMSVGFSILIVYATILPFIVEHILGQTSIVYGHATFFIGISYLVGSLINRSLLRYTIIDKIILCGVYGLLLFSALMLLMSFVFPMNIFTLYIPILFLTVSVGVIFPSCLSKCISLFPEKAGTASAIAGSGFMLISAISSSIIGNLPIRSNLDISLVFLVLTFISFIVWYSLLRNNTEMSVKKMRSF